jgi:signal transduction histidine kinase
MPDEAYVRIVIIAIVVLPVILIFFIYTSYKKTILQQKQKSINETEKKLSKRVHDEVANEIYILMNKIQHQKKPSKEEVLDHLETIYKRSRNISREFDSAGLLKNYRQSLNLMLTSFQNENANVLIQNSTPEFWKNLNNSLKLNIYRILQELMTNMKKHSDANVVVIAFNKEREIVEIKYTDNGKGFDLEKGIAYNGLKNIKNRMQNLNGTIDFEKTEKGVKAFIKFT